MSGAKQLPLDQPELTFRAAGNCLVRRTVHPTGVRILSESVPGARSASIGIWVAVGSRDEDAVAFGSTHFLEHLLFKGTKTRTALDLAVSFDAVGGENNAMTAKEYTCYYAKVRDQDMQMATEVLIDMVTSSVIDKGDFELERGVILEELAMADDDPVDVMYERFHETLFGQHPIGRPIGGTPETIQSVSRDAVWDHYQRTYLPHDLVITVAGAVDHDRLVSDVLESLERAGIDLSVEHAPAPRRSVASAPPTLDSRVSVVHRPLEQANLVVGSRSLTADDDRRPTLAVLNSVLGSGMSSRLFQEIREKRGLAYSVYSTASAYSDSGLFALYAGCSPSRTLEVAEILVEQFHRLANEPISQQELERAFGQIAGGSALALEDNGSRMSRLGRAELTLGEFVDLDESLRRLHLVTPDQVQELAGELAAQPLSASVVGPVTDDVLSSLISTPTQSHAVPGLHAV